MKIGAHVSVQGGLDQAFKWVAKYTCESLQIFTKSQLQWAAKPLAADEVAAFRAAWDAHGSIPALVHNSYLINLASPDEALWGTTLGLQIFPLPWVEISPRYRLYSLAGTANRDKQWAELQAHFQF